MLYLVSMIALSYFIGSFPTSIVAGKLLKGIDIRKYGSGNAGATNAMRILGWKAGLVVLLVDMAKGFVAVVWIDNIGALGVGWQPVNLQIVAGLAAVAGHIWTVFAGFKGGKGVGTGAGMLLGIAPIAMSFGLIVFVAIVGISRYVSLASIMATLSIPVAEFSARYAFGLNIPFQKLVISIIIPALILYTHRSNIGRLWRGEEPKLNFHGSGENQ